MIGPAIPPDEPVVTPTPERTVVGKRKNPDRFADWGNADVEVKRDP